MRDDFYRNSHLMFELKYHSRTCSEKLDSKRPFIDHKENNKVQPILMIMVNITTLIELS